MRHGNAAIKGFGLMKVQLRACVTHSRHYLHVETMCAPREYQVVTLLKQAKKASWKYNKEHSSKK